MKQHLEKWRLCSCQLAVMLTYRIGTRPLIACTVLAFTIFVIFLNWNSIQSPPQPRNLEIKTPTSKPSKAELQNMSRNFRGVIANISEEYNQKKHCHGGRVLKNLELFPEFSHLKSCQRILYNRVPKCGSRAVLSTVKILAEQRHFSVLASPRLQRQSFFAKVAYEDAFVLNFTTFPEPFFYSQHLHFVNFTSYGLHPPVYINVVREPLERLLSHYFYSIFGSNGAPYSTPLTKKQTLEQCISKAGRGCMLLNTVIPFFCGHKKNCRQPSPTRQSLAVAKRAVRESYLVVGLQEDLYSFMEVLQVLMPHFFTNATEVYTATEEEFKRRFATVKKPEVAQRTLGKLKKLLGLEYEFYAFIKQRFYSLHNRVMSLTRDRTRALQDESDFKSRELFPSRKRRWS